MAYSPNNPSVAIAMNQQLAQRNEPYTIAFQLNERYPTIMPCTFGPTTYADTYKHIVTMALAGDVLSQKVLVFTAEVEEKYISNHDVNAPLLPVLAVVKMQPWFCKEVLQT